MAQTTEYQKDLIKALKDPVEAAAYLTRHLQRGIGRPFFWPCATWPRPMGAWGRWRTRPILTEKACIALCHVAEIPRSAPCLICCTG